MQKRKEYAEIQQKRWPQRPAGAPSNAEGKPSPPPLGPRGGGNAIWKGNLRCNSALIICSVTHSFLGKMGLPRTVAMGLDKCSHYPAPARDWLSLARMSRF